MDRAEPLSAEDPKTAGIPRAGDVIAEKYRVERVLGVGGMGVVLAVTHLQLGEPYAIKCLLPGGAADPETVERFMREARAAVRIKSEHIARVSDVGKLASGSPYILMEHLSGRDLSAVLEADGPLPLTDAVEYVLQACTGIAEAHALGIVHRDLKPSNLFLTQRPDGASLVKVLDFGISKAVGDSALHAPSLTQTASVFGSPAYMSPEQIRSAKNVDFRADVWALGIILYELLTGELPFLGETSGGLLSAIAADEPQSLRERRPDAAELDAVVRRCLEKNVQKRFQSVSELANALEPFRGAGSLVSMGRIRRLSGVAAVESTQLATAMTSARTQRVGGDHVDVGAPTARAWITAAPPAKSGRALLALVVVAALAMLLGVGGFFAVRRSSVSTSVAPTVTPPLAAEPLTPASVAAAPAATPAATSEPSLAPTAQAPGLATAAAKPPGARAGRPGTAAPASAARSAGRAPAAPPPPGTAPGAPALDPFGTSH